MQPNILDLSLYRKSVFVERLQIYFSANKGFKTSIPVQRATSLIGQKIKSSGQLIPFVRLFNNKVERISAHSFPIA